MTSTEITTAETGRKSDWSLRSGALTEELKKYIETKTKSALEK